MQRLCQHREFEAVFEHNHVVSSRLHVVRLKPNNLSFARLGIIAGRKALPKAVDRNRGKRLVREVFRLAEARLAAWDIVVQLRAELQRHDNVAIRQDLHKLFAVINKNQEH